MQQNNNSRNNNNHEKSSGNLEMIEGLTLFTLLSAKSWLENTVVETEQCTTKFFKPVFKTSLKAF